MTITIQPVNSVLVIVTSKVSRSVRRRRFGRRVVDHVRRRQLDVGADHAVGRVLVRLAVVAAWREEKAAQDLEDEIAATASSTQRMTLRGCGAAIEPAASTTSLPISGSERLAHVPVWIASRQRAWAAVRAYPARQSASCLPSLPVARSSSARLTSVCFVGSGVVCRLRSVGLVEAGQEPNDQPIDTHPAESEPDEHPRTAKTGSVPRRWSSQ